MNTISTDELADPNRRNGNHWFSKDTKRFFASRVSNIAYLNADRTKAYFVSSERCNFIPRDRRLYTVRVCTLANGDVDTVGEFQAYASRSGAHAAALRASQS